MVRSIQAENIENNRNILEKLEQTWCGWNWETYEEVYAIDMCKTYKSKLLSYHTKYLILSKQFKIKIVLASFFRLKCLKF